MKISHDIVEKSYGPVMLIHTVRLTGIVMPVKTTRPTLFIACTTRRVAAYSLAEWILLGTSSRLC